MDGPEIWQEAPQHCCGDAYQISGPSSKIKHRSCDLETWRDLGFVSFIETGSWSLSKHHRNGLSHLVLPCSVFLALTPSLTNNTDAYSFEVSESIHTTFAPARTHLCPKITDMDFHTCLYRGKELQILCYSQPLLPRDIKGELRNDAYSLTLAEFLSAIM